MHALKQALSPLLCCFGIRPSGENPSSDLSNLQQPASALSIQLPASTVPHAVGQSPSNVADTDALRQIFRSSSSVRGYRTASQSSALPVRKQPSLDVEFKFGQAGKDRRHLGRLEQLGSHIRQKLSESRLSKASSKHHESEETTRDTTGVSLHRLGVDIPEAAISQRSTGLLELLMSRAGSEGGYDSDARSIHTAALRETDGPPNPNSQTAAEVIRTPGVHMAAEESPRTRSGSPVSQEADTSAMAPTPPQTSFIEIVLQEANRSPIKLLQRLSVGLSSGTIKLPDANGMLGTPQAPINEIRDASPGSQRRDRTLYFEGALRRLSATVAAAKTQSLASDAENARDSLLSDLDPELIGFISKFGQQSPMRASNRSSHENGPNGRRQSPQPGDLFDQISVLASVPGEPDALTKEMRSLTDSDRSSVHLYNMRISQQLASPSVTASGSRPETSHTSIEQPKNEPMEAFPAISRLSLSEKHPSWIAIEHNRRPSDPQTRRLFEDVVPSDKSKSQLKHVVTIASAVGSKPETGPVNSDDGSSIYFSDGEISVSDKSRLRTPRRNPNSIAVAGRSESISLPVGSSSGSMSHIPLAAEGAWFGRRSSQMKRNDQEASPNPPRQRSTSMPTGNQLGLLTVCTTQRRHERVSTEYYETMSEISAEQIQDTRREQLTEVSAQAVHDAYNERMSDIEPGPISWSRERQSAPDNSQLHQTSGRQQTESVQEAGENIGLETTTDMWRRTLKRAIEEPQGGSVGGFLTAPKFDRNGRRRSSTSSHSAAKSEKEAQATVSDNVASSRGLQHGPTHTSAEEKSNIHHGSLRSKRTQTIDPRRSVPAADAEVHPQNPAGQRKAPKKKSVLDLGKRFTESGVSAQDDRHQGTFRDLLGLWGRFPSHSREIRCGPAGASDGVAVREFALECMDENTAAYPAPQAPWNRSALSLGLHTPATWRRLQFGNKAKINKRKSKSLDVLRNSVNEPRLMGLRTTKNGKGLVAKWKRIYRSSSSDLRAYTQTYGHRSSISMSASAEYPELEIIAGHDGSHDSRPVQWGVAGNGVTAREVGQQHPNEASQFRAGGVKSPQLSPLPWTTMYKECVGSLSALKSDVDLQQQQHVGQTDGTKQHDDKPGSDSANLRSSTLDFGVQLGREHEAVREGLIKKLETKQDCSERTSAPHREGA